MAPTSPLVSRSPLSGLITPGRGGLRSARPLEPKKGAPIPRQWAFLLPRTQAKRKETEELSSAASILSPLFRNGDPATLLEPLLRTFVLGLATGTLVEVGHVLYQFLGLLTDVGGERVLQVFPSVADQFSPLFFVDHIAAVGAWAFLYGLELLAVVSLLKQKPGKKDYTEDLARLRTLSKKLLPVNLKSVVSLLLLNLRSSAPSSVGNSASATGAEYDVGFQPSVSGPVPSSVPRPAGVKMSEPLIPPQEERTDASASRVPEIPPPASDPIEPTPENVARRRQEIKTRKSFLRNFWYAIALSDEVGNKPHAVEALSMKLVLFRGKDGKVKCLRDSCPHRSAPLSDGSVENVAGHNCLVCPYHGWAIDDSGCIKDVPAAEGPGQWPSSQQVETYVIEERGGFVWLFYEGPKGNRLPAEERPPIPCIPELEDPNWTPVYGELEFNCGHWAVFENAIDMAHIHYLHGDSFGNGEKPVVMNMDGTTDAYGVTTTFDIHNKPVSPIWNFTATESVPVVAKALLPSTSMIKIKLGAGIEFITYVCTVPITKEKCVNRFALLRNFLPWPAEAWEPWARNAMFKILEEDKEMIERLRPEETIREVSVRADLPQILFRKLRQQYIDMGYGYSPESLDVDKS